MAGGARDAAALRLLDVRDLATVFGVGEPAIRKRIRLGLLGPVLKVGRGYRMRREALDEFLRRQEQGWLGETA